MIKIKQVSIDEDVASGGYKYINVGATRYVAKEISEFQNGESGYTSTGEYGFKHPSTGTFHVLLDSFGNIPSTSGVSELADLTDVNTSSPLPIKGALLEFDGGVWRSYTQKEYTYVSPEITIINPPATSYDLWTITHNKNKIIVPKIYIDDGTYYREVLTEILYLKTERLNKTIVKFDYPYIQSDIIIMI